MSIDPYVAAVMAGMAAVTVIPRVLPLVVLSRLALPDWLRSWLGYVPVAVLASLLARELFFAGGRPALPPENPALLAAAPAFLVALRTRSLTATVLVGIAAMALLRRLG